MKNEKINISQVLMKNKHVNNYTKLLIILSQLHFYEDYYIPNSKLVKMLNVNKKRVIVLLKQLRDDNVIAIFYKGRKRFFTFLEIQKKEEKKIDSVQTDIFDYDWLKESYEKERNDKYGK